MPSAVGLLILGIVLLVVDYFVPMPPPLHTLLRVLGWICAIVGALLLILAILGLSVGFAPLR